VRGNAERIATIARQYPSLFEFSSDEDLTLLALVGGLERNEDAIWGVEQSTGAVRYLEELVALAPNAAARQRAKTLANVAQSADHENKYTVIGSSQQRLRPR